MSSIKEMLEDLDMESWLEHEGVHFKLGRGRSGLQANIQTCPSCGDNRWKTYFGLETGAGNCFACDKRFSKWEFIKDQLELTTNRDVVQAIETFLGMAGKSIKRSTSLAVNLKSDLVIPDSTPIETVNHPYLERRNVDLELAKYHHLRFCESGMFEYMGPFGKMQFQDYSDRIIFPIFDLEGELVSFQGRDITGQAEKKYIFPPGFAATGAHIYNGHNCWRAKKIVMGEGVFDEIAIRDSLDSDDHTRVYGSCASFGKNLSDGEGGQVEKLLRLKNEGHLEEVIFMWDAEQKAIEAAVRAALMVKSYGLKARIALLPPGRDPNEVSKDVVLGAIKSAREINRNSAIAILMKARALK